MKNHSLRPSGVPLSEKIVKTPENGRWTSTAVVSIAKAPSFGELDGASASYSSST